MPFSMTEEEPLQKREGAVELEDGRALPHSPSSAIMTPQGSSEGERGAAGAGAVSSSRAAWLLGGDATGAGTALVVERWVALVRKRSGTYPRCSGFPNRSPKLDPRMPFGILRSFSNSSSTSGSSSDGIDHHPRLEGADINDSPNALPSEQVPETCLWERLGSAATLDIESSEFFWDTLSSLHHTEHTSSTEQSEDEMNRALEVTVNSGGVVFFALFSSPENNDIPSKEAAAVIKISSSRMATQSERLGYEFARRLGVQTPQARVIHNSSPEWQRIKDAADKARDIAVSMHDDVGEITCSELVEALELSRCLLLMNYVHGSPLLESPEAFGPQDAAEKTAATLGRVLMLDLILRNEDRLPCRQLGWRGNSANLLFTHKSVPENMDVLGEASDSDPRRFSPRVIKTLQKERRANSVDSRICPHKPDLIFQTSDALNDSNPKNINYQVTDEIKRSDFQIVAIDSGVPRRPPAGKRAKDQAYYPRGIELLLNNAEFASNILYEISGEKLGLPSVEDDISVSPTNSSACFSESDITTIVNEFRGGFRAAFRDLQEFYLFLLTLYQKLDGLLRVFLSVVEKNTGEAEKQDLVLPELPVHVAGLGFNTPTHCGRERSLIETPADLSDSELQKTTPRSSSPLMRESPDSACPISRENWSGRYSKGSGETSSVRLTTKLRDLSKFAKENAELNKEMEQWNEMFRTDVIKLCQDNDFNTGFFEGSDSNTVVDAYELKVRLEHVLERIALIYDAANTERPSSVTTSMFIGGALAARSIYTLQHLGISHILCLCSNETGQSESQNPDLFEYKNFSISDNDDTDISNIFEEAFSFIDYVELKGGKILVHCFEGRSRSATVVLAYLLLRKNLKLSEAWNLLKKAHRRAQPNDGFAKILVEIDKKLHGTASMEWQHRRPVMKVCPICGKNAGLSSNSLRLHLQKVHMKIISSGSVDTAINMEIQKALDALKISHGDSVMGTLEPSIGHAASAPLLPNLEKILFTFKKM